VFTNTRAVAALLATCALAVPVAGCGGGGGDQDDIQGVVDDFSSALLDTDGNKVCDLLTENAIKELTGGTSRDDCAKVIDDAGDPSDDDRKQLENPEVTDLKVDGDTATAKVQTEGDDDPSGTKFRKVDGEWLIDGEQ
jgi:hypothetical protein